MSTIQERIDMLDRAGRLLDVTSLDRRVTVGVLAAACQGLYTATDMLDAAIERCRDDDQLADLYSRLFFTRRLVSTIQDDAYKVMGQCEEAAGAMESVRTTIRREAHCLSDLAEDGEQA